MVVVAGPAVRPGTWLDVWSLREAPTRQPGPHAQSRRHVPFSRERQRRAVGGVRHLQSRGSSERREGVRAVPRRGRERRYADRTTNLASPAGEERGRNTFHTTI